MYLDLSISWHCQTAHSQILRKLIARGSENLRLLIGQARLEALDGALKAALVLASSLHQRA